MLAQAPSASVLALLEWISLRPRSYSETLEVWHTHCPRLPVWEDALEAGLVEVRRDDSWTGSLVVRTPEGRSALRT